MKAYLPLLQLLIRFPEKKTKKYIYKINRKLMFSDVHTTEECIAENTIISASEGLNPFPKSTDAVINSSFNCLRTPKHA